MRKLFDLVGKITVDGIETLNKNLTDITKTAESVIKPLAKLGNQATRLGKQLTTDLTLPITAVAASVGVLTDKVADYADHMLDLVEITGLSSDSLQEYEQVSVNAGVSFDGLVGTIQNLSKKLPQIAKEGGKAFEAIYQLGVDVYDTNGNLRNMNDIFPEMIKALQNIEDKTLRNSIAQQIFGAELKDIAPVLGMTNDEFERARNEAHEFGNVLSNEALQDAGKFRVEIDKLKLQFDKLVKGLSIDLIPVITNVFIPMIKNSVIPIVRDELVPAIKGIANWWNNLPKGIQESVIKFGAFVAIAGPAVLLLGQILSSVTLITTALKTAQVALLAFNATMLANPFGVAVLGIAAATGAIIGLVNEYKNLQREHQKYTLMTVDQAKKNEFVKGFDTLIQKIKEYGDTLKDETQFNQLLGKSIEDLSTQAQELGFTITGNNEERLKALNTIALELQGVRDTNGQLIKYTASTEENTEAKNKNKRKTLEQIEAEKKLAEEQKKLAEERLKFETDWSNKAYDSTDTKLDILNRQESDALESANKIGADTTAITAYYSSERQKLLEDERQAEGAKNREKILNEIAEGKKAAEAKIESEKKVADEKEKLDKKEEERRSYLKNTIVGGIVDTFNLISQFSQNRIQQIDNELKADIAAIEHSKMTKEEKEKAILELETKADKKKRELQRKAAIAEKAGAIFSIVLSTAQAIMKAVGQLGPIAGAIAGVAMGVLGAAQIAIVASKPIPLAKGGLAKSTDGGIDATIAEGGQDELVLPLRTGVKLLVDEFLQRLSSITLPDLPLNAQASSNRSDVVNNSSMVRDVHIHAGIIIADDFTKKRFAQDIKKYLIMEDQRIAVAGV